MSWLPLPWQCVCLSIWVGQVIQGRHGESGACCGDGPGLREVPVDCVCVSPLSLLLCDPHGVGCFRDAVS